MANKKRMYRFFGVGIFNTLLDFLFFTLLTQTVFTETSQIAVVGFISGTFALLVAFMLHSLITWRGAHINHKTFLKFFIFTGFGMWVIRPVLLAVFIRLDGVYRFAHNLSQDLNLPFSHDFITNTGAFGFMAIFVLAYNYLIYDRFVFTKRSTGTEPENR